MKPSWKLVGAAGTLAAVSLAWIAGPGCALMPGHPDYKEPPYKPPRYPRHAASIRRTTYQGWRDAIVMNNGKVTVVIIPAIGRVMQFGFTGEEGVFWENTALHGQPALKGEWSQTDWVNLGGDKSWPAPETDWEQFTGRSSWRPPVAFDGLPWTAVIAGDFVVLTSQVDPAYGIRVERRIRLYPGTTDMTIQTLYHRVSGKPARIGVWVITQLREPTALFAPVPADSKFPTGFTLLGKDAPPGLRSENGFVSLPRDSKSAHKLGLDGGSLLWVGAKHMLRIDSARQPGAEYPDHGSSVEIYTNPDPLRYVELETVGPLESLKPGESVERSNTYTLLRRTKPTPEAEATALYPR